MNIIDNRSPYEQFYEQFTAAFDELTEAESAVIAAKRKMDKIWDDHLKYCVNREIALVEKESVLIQDGAWLYQIQFDIEDYLPPEISRVDDFTAIYKTQR